MQIANSVYFSVMGYVNSGLAVSVRVLRHYQRRYNKGFESIDEGEEGDFPNQICSVHNFSLPVTATYEYPIPWINNT
jgi:hypothetical protein